MTPEICPNCGAEVPPRAKACPECGSDEHTGWSEKAATDHLDLPDEEFDYDEFVKREFGQKKSRALPKSLLWVIVALALLIAFILPFILRR
ncbi:MAG TPA: zinc ribbon domain-containing protein [Verrucomicrobiae bacterium]|nr:zinc ribbon domain-containing protein [Verrucomicrobiae bacterium]